jgi:hypothetical protein
MARVVVLLIILTFSFCSYPQKIIKTNIIKKDKELYEAIKSDRKAVRQYITTGNTQLKNYIDKYHTYRYKSNKTYILNYNERLIAQYASGSFENIIKDINTNQHLKRRITDNNQHYDPILENEELKIKSISQRILDNIAKSNLSNYQKELLTLYYKTLINSLYNSFYTTYFEQDEINHKSEALIAFAKIPRQKAFIKRRIIADTEINSILSYSIEVINTYIYSGDYSKYLYNKISFGGFSLNYIKRNIYFNLSWNMHFADLKNDIPNEELWKKNERLIVYYWEGGIGYPFTISKRLLIAPMVNLASFSYGIYGSKENSPSQTSLNLGANIHLKFSPKMQRLSDLMNYSMLIPNSIKLFVGYQPMLQKDALELQGGAIVLKLGIGRF